MKSEFDRDRLYYKNKYIYYKSMIYSIIYLVIKRECFKEKYYYFKFLQRY